MELKIRSKVTDHNLTKKNSPVKCPKAEHTPLVKLKKGKKNSLPMNLHDFFGKCGPRVHLFSHFRVLFSFPGESCVSLHPVRPTQRSSQLTLELAAFKRSFNLSPLVTDRYICLLKTNREVEFKKDICQFGIVVFKKSIHIYICIFVSIYAECKIPVHKKYEY